MSDKNPAAALGEVSVQPGELLATLHMQRRLVPLLREVAVAKWILRQAERAVLRVADNQLQAAADRFRYRNGLESAAATARWLAAEGQTIDCLEVAIYRDLLTAQFKQHLTQPRVAGHFAQHRDRYSQARLRRILVDSEDLARELRAQLTDEGRDFAELARQQSLDSATRRAGGSMGLVRRAEMPAEVAAAVIGAKAGDVLGPVAVEGSYLLYLVEELPEPTLDEAMAALIRDELFSIWVREQWNAVQIDLSWLQSRDADS